MNKKIDSLYQNFLTSNHLFKENELLDKFKYQVLNNILIVMGVFTFIFATLSVTGINPLGIQQTIANYVLVLITIVLTIALRGPKSRYNIIIYIMYISAYLAFLTALIFVPNDEFRIIWFYLLVFAAYITGGLKAGNLIASLSIITIIVVYITHGLNISQTGTISATLGLVIASLFFRAYSKKISDLEQETIEQREFIISQSRLAAMGEMLSMIAHQWRQPLSTTTLMITNERVNMMMAKEKDDNYSKILDKISDTMIYLSDTIDDFQTYFKPEKSTQTIELNTLIRRVEQFIKPRTSMTEVELQINECDNINIDTYTNELIQSIINILNNAIDILIQRKIKDPEISIWCDSSDVDVTIYIEDNGGGIKDDIIHKVFEPYVSSKSKNGTGLGLYMSKMIVDQHIGGPLNVKNSSKGALFSIAIPKIT